MSWFVSDELVPVDLEGCRCPGSPHDHDIFWLHPELGTEAGLAALLVISAVGDDTAQLTEKLGRLYVERGVAAWNLLDENGAPLPVSSELLSHLGWDAAYPIADKAAVLYSEALTRPLVARVSASSRNGHTAPSTSARKRSPSSRPKR